MTGQKTENKRRIAIGSDHAGFELKQFLVKSLPEIEWADQGTFSTDSVDYPDLAEKVGNAVALNKAEAGVLVCGSGIGMSIAANKVDGIRAANVESDLGARLSRQHNDSNVICLGSRILAPEYAKEILKTWLNTPFDGGRHEKRVRKIADLEKKKNGSQS